MRSCASRSIAPTATATATATVGLSLFPSSPLPPSPFQGRTLSSAPQTNEPPPDTGDLFQTYRFTEKLVICNKSSDFFFSLPTSLERKEGQPARHRLFSLSLSPGARMPALPAYSCVARACAQLPILPFLSNAGARAPLPHTGNLPFSAFGSRLH